MNSSIYSADRATHLRIVAVVFAFSVAIAGLAISAPAGPTGSAQATNSVHAGKAWVPGRNAVAAREVTGQI